MTPESGIVERSVQTMIEVDIDKGSQQCDILVNILPFFSAEHQDEILFALFFNDLIGRFTATGELFYNYAVTPLIRYTTKWNKIVAFLAILSICASAVIYSLYRTLMSPMNGADVWLDSWLYGILLNYSFIYSLFLD